MDPRTGAAAVYDDPVPPLRDAPRGPGLDEEVAEKKSEGDREREEDEEEAGFGGDGGRRGGVLGVVGPGEEVGSGGGSDGELYRIHRRRF